MFCMERTTNDGFAPLRDGRGRGRRRGGGARAPRGAARRARRRRRAPDDVRRLPVRPRRVRPLPRDGPERRAMEAGERGSPRLFATMGAPRFPSCSTRTTSRRRCWTSPRSRSRAYSTPRFAFSTVAPSDRSRARLHRARIAVAAISSSCLTAKGVARLPALSATTRDQCVFWAAWSLAFVAVPVEWAAASHAMAYADLKSRGPRLSPPPPPPPRRRRRRRRRRDGPAPRRRRGLSFGRGERRGRRRRTQTPLEEEGQGEHAGRAAETVLPGPPHLVRRVRVSRPIRDRRRVRRVLYTGPHTTALAW